MELFKLEHKKLWRKNSTRICVLLCFFYCVIFGSVLIYQWITFGSRKDSTDSSRNFDGYENIRNCQAYFHKYGELTDETLQEWVRDYQRMHAAVVEEEKKKGPADREILKQYQNTGWQAVNSMIKTLYPELEDPDMFAVMIMSCYVEPERLTGLYGRRVEALERFLDISGQTGEEREYLLRINDRVHAPFSWKWAEGWSNVLGNAIADLGTEGWDMPVQTVKMIAIAPMNMLQAEIYEYAFTLLGALGFAGVVMLFSALCKNHVLALLLSLAVVYGPMSVHSRVPALLGKTFDLLPLVGSGADIFRTNTFRIFGYYIWSPYLLIWVPFVIGILCLLPAVRGWARRMRK